MGTCARPRQSVLREHRHLADERDRQFDRERPRAGAAHRAAHSCGAGRGARARRRLVEVRVREVASMNPRVVLGADFVALALVLASVSIFAQPIADTADPDLIRNGEYVAIAGDCVACHTTPGGKPFAGGLPLPTPIGNIIATNITPSRTAGIGNYTLAQFTAAMRKGIRADGAHLYPAMPYTAYVKVTDDDVRALYAYFMHAVAPVDMAPPPTRL